MLCTYTETLTIIPVVYRDDVLWTVISFACKYEQIKMGFQTLVVIRMF